MKTLFLLFLLISSFSSKIIAQHSVDSSFPFAKGVYIRNSVLLPWGTNFDEIKNYNPKIICSNKTTKVSWDSIYIFDSVRVNLWAFFWRCFEKHKPTGRLHSLNGSIDTSDIRKINSFLEKYTDTRPKLTTHKKRYTYYWQIDDCRVRLDFKKRYGAFLYIQTINESYYP
jgi:hypothetical protein